MPDTRCHRGAHPSDATNFETRKLPILQTAVQELAWLLSRNYALTSALKLVGDHHGLNKRQRVALSRAACSDQSRAERQATCLSVERIINADIMVDGFNLLITIEAALAGGVILWCRDGCLRDLASVHGSYRLVEETQRALCLIGNVLETLKPRTVQWLLDQPVSNSGRLAQTIRAEAETSGWPWHVEVVVSPDTILMRSEQIVVSSDSTVLDHAACWINLPLFIISNHLPKAWIIDLSV